MKEIEMNKENEAYQAYVLAREQSWKKSDELSAAGFSTKAISYNTEYQELVEKRDEYYSKWLTLAQML